MAMAVMMYFLKPIGMAVEGWGRELGAKVEDCAGAGKVEKDGARAFRDLCKGKQCASTIASAGRTIKDETYKSECRE